MSEITLTIDGKEVKGERGDTILQVCEKNGVFVPTLCHCQGLKDVGTCRMCMVELQGGVRLGAACTTPAEDKMVVATDTPKVNALRRSTLELLFSERNHYCMFCEASGDCELQRLGYRYGVDSWRYPALYPKKELDTTHPFLVLDHNRCILCRRCVRACNELVANHSLGVIERGISTMLGADGGEQMGDSSCVSCGVCVQVCPTGALFDRRSSYRGRLDDCTVVRSACTGCSLGCEVNFVTRSNQVLRVEGVFDSPVSEGMLCKHGRYESLDCEQQRVLQPMVRKNGALEPATWDEALATVSTRLTETAAAHGAHALTAIASARATTEALTALQALFLNAYKSERVYAVGANLAPAGNSATLADVTAADVIVLAGQNAGAEHPVLEFFLGRAVEQNEATLVVVGAAGASTLRRAKVKVPANGSGVAAALKRLADAGSEAGMLVADARRPLFILDAPLGETCELLAGLAPRAEKRWPRTLLLGRKANSRGAGQAGLTGGRPYLGDACAAFVLAGDDPELLQGPPPDCKKIEFLAVQASYHSRLTDVADVVLPAPIWTEQQGTITNSQGQQVALRPALPLPGEVRPEVEVLAALAAASR